jgi:ABC-type multidrug transport system fused ATPase/permease subunit
MRYQVLLEFFKPYKLRYAIILVLTLVSSVLASLSLAAFFPLFSSILGESASDQGSILSFITDLSDFMPFSDPTVAAAALLVALFLAKNAANMMREAVIAYASGKVLFDAKDKILSRYAGARYQFFLDTNHGSLIYNGLVATHTLANLLLAVPNMVADLAKILAIVVILAFISPLAAVALGILGISYFGIAHLLSIKVSYQVGKGKTEAYSEQTTVTNEFLNGIRQIMIFRTSQRWLSRFRVENRKHSSLFIKESVWLAVPKNLLEFTAIVVMLGFVLVLKSTSPDTFATALPILGVYAMALIQLLPAIASVGRTRMQVMASMADAELVHHSMVGPIPQYTDGDKAMESFERSVSFEDLTFAHKGREPLLQGVDLTFEKGKVTALVGPSGAGKTTIINLILGLFEPSGGRVTIDDLSLQDYQIKTWLGRIGFVSQEPFIFHASIAENIAFSRSGYSRECIIKAAEIANAHGFIAEFPEGYDTVVGEHGMKLSGGQQQRVAIARAVLDEPEVLIFDEATSSLDSISERLVQEAIETASKDRTVIMIAHRLSTIRHADKIIVLDQGRVAEQGTHQELLERQGHYSGLVASSG